MDERLVIELVSSRSLLIEPAAVSLLSAMPEEQAREVLDEVIGSAGDALVLTRGLVSRVLQQRLSPDAVPAVGQAFEPFAKNVAPMLSLEREEDVTGESRCTGSLQDFVAYFNDRFHRLKKMLSYRQTRHAFASTQKVKTFLDKRRSRLTGMVSSKRDTRQGHLLVELEDEEGVVPCLFSKNDYALFQQAQALLLDEVVACDGFHSNGLFIAEALTWPDVPIREKKRVEGDVNIAFVSDLHLGSKYFLEENFEKLLHFFNGEGEEAELAGSVKYLLVAGDLVDGIGVYPTQEKQLVTKNIFEQYELFAGLMEGVPPWIEVVVSPGNHDAVRTAEPQPRLPKEFTCGLEKKKNFHFVGNPALVDVHGLKALLYHGTSLDTLVAALPTLRSGYQNPEIVGVEMLKRRHLCPIYGEKPIVPEPRDYLLIESVPDLFHFGHVHKNGYSSYRGTTIINSGTWQDVTDYQLKQGHVPSPCQLPLYNVSTGNIKVLDFK